MFDHIERIVMTAFKKAEGGLSYLALNLKHFHLSTEVLISSVAFIATAAFQEFSFKSLLLNEYFEKYFI